MKGFFGEVEGNEGNGHDHNTGYNTAVYKAPAPVLLEHVQEHEID